MQTLFLATGWIMLFAFVITFVVAILATTRVIRLADPKFIKILFVKLLIEVVAAGFFLFYKGTFSYSEPYTGTWKARIDWTPQFAQTLFNADGSSQFTPASPRSEGTIYVFKFNGVYTGFSQWETKNGGETYSKLFVRIEHFYFDPSGKLERWNLTTAVREKIKEFSYGPFFTYSMKFDSTNPNHLSGTMVVVDQQGKRIEVGKVEAERVI